MKGGLEVEKESFEPDEGWDLSGAELMNYHEKKNSFAILLQYFNILT